MIIQIFSSSIASSSQSSLSEGAPGADQNRPAAKHPPPKHSEFCRDWLLNRCQRGYYCLYVHGDLEYDPPVKGRHPPPLYPEVCYKWLRNECTSGYVCRFVHGDLEYDPLIPDKETLPAPRNLTTVVRLYLELSSLGTNCSLQKTQHELNSTIGGADAEKVRRLPIAATIIDSQAYAASPGFKSSRPSVISHHS
jgi:hypothetical protein